MNFVIKLESKRLENLRKARSPLHLQYSKNGSIFKSTKFYMISCICMFLTFFFFLFSNTLISNFSCFLILNLFTLSRKCNLYPKPWSPSSDKSITVSCDAVMKSHPKDMGATTFVTRDKRSIPLLVGVC